MLSPVTYMRITFSDADLHAIACSQFELARRFGPKVGAKLCQRFAELHAVPTVSAATKLTFIGLRRVDDGFIVPVLGTHQICFKKTSHETDVRGASVAHDTIEVFSIREIHNG